MSASNLRQGLERKFADWLGERQDIQKHIADVTAAYEGLGEKRKRLAAVENLVKSTQVIMDEIAPTWNPASIKPSRRNFSKIPFASGEVTRMAFDVMRREDRQMRSFEIAKLVVQDKGLDVEDRDLVSRVKAAIDASLISKKGKFVDATEGYGKEWFILQEDRPIQPGQSDP